MKAAVVHAFGEPLTMDERDIPDPGPGEILVRIEASGLCHTDIHAAHGDWPVKPTLPFVPGHEGVGIIEALGRGVMSRAVGERVALPWLGYACGQCRYCIDGRETLCEQQRNTGYSVDGAFGQFALAHARFAVPVPPGVDPWDAAPLTCAGVTTYKALKVAAVTPSETVAVFGVGGLGHLAVQYARVFGARVIAVDVEPDKLQLARDLGADMTADASSGDADAQIRELGGADVAIVLAASSTVFEQAFRSLRRGGRLVCVALPAEGMMSLPIFDTVLKGISIIGSIVGTRQDLAEVFALHAAGRTRVVLERRPLDTVNDSMADVLAGRVPARVVFEMPPINRDELVEITGFDAEAAR
ncbi:alcohol dehydrogenase AdhP [Curtobacterium ammoniigenes]|uniref:alcohol dehydrogenase AdhP n=1 Tax=Curtobacterium ammoniigenes TaxID=395387 RepID=UPI0009FA6A76|nr:alcohol dehydrogenase AdhP [Curtobacterium ammoniigenes]